MQVSAGEDFSHQNMAWVISLVLSTSQQGLNVKDTRLPAHPSAEV